MTHDLTLMKNPPPSNGVRVLIVEDDPFIAMDLEDTLIEAGYKVCALAGSVAEGLLSLERERPSVATLDYHLGSETSDAIASALDERAIPYCYISGNAHELGGATAPVISKPVAPRTVVRTVGRLVAN